MGFDIECIVNIQSLAGEYFCPVCRLLVYPNEALQSQCTHLYCKPCLTYVVGTTRACPYDGYLVTEADSKPLTESNKALAETIGKIAVHCLYHRSGCTWQGPLSECTSHCSGCAYGNSPVVCNRCGIQIVHRQVQEHAQSCPGVQPQTQQAQNVQDTSASGTAAAAVSADTSQASAQPGASSSQGQISQTAAAPPAGQDPNQQSSANPQSQVVAPAAGPTPEQWYNQQYQQYYQQYPGYDPYQQAYQQYYPYQQPAVQQYQQNTQHVQGQHQQQAFMQPQAPVQPQPQPQPQTQVPVQSQAQQQVPVQPQAQQQVPVQPQQQQQVSAQPQQQVHSQPQPPLQPQSHQNVQAPLAAQHQNQAPVNPQQQVHPPHGHPHPQPLHQMYPQARPPQPHPQHVQMPQYQQPIPQMQHPQPQIQPQPHPQVQPQNHSLPQPQPPAHPLAHPQVQHPPHTRPPLHLPPQSNQPPNTNIQPQTQLPPANPVTGHQSYPQPQAVQQMPVGGGQQPMNVHPQSGSLPQHPSQMHNQFPPQHPHLRPPQSHVPMQSQQQSAMLPPQGQVASNPPVQHTLHPHVQPGQPVQQRPVMQQIQQPVPQHFVQGQQQQPFPGQTSVAVQNQLPQQVHHMQPQQPPMQPHMRPSPNMHLQSQQNVQNLQPHQSQNYVGRPTLSNHGLQSQTLPQSTGGYAGPAQGRPMQLGPNQQSMNLNYFPRPNNQHHIPSEQQSFQPGMASKPSMSEAQGDHSKKSVGEGESGSPAQLNAKTEANGLVPTGLGADPVEKRFLNSEPDLNASKTEQKFRGGNEDNIDNVDEPSKGTDSKLHAGQNGTGEALAKHMVKKENTEGTTIEPSLRGSDIVAEEQKQVEQSSLDDSLLHQAESFEVQGGKLPKDDVENRKLVSSDAGKASHDIPLAPDHVPNNSISNVPAPDSSQIPLNGREPVQHGFQDRNMNQSQVTPQGPRVDEHGGFYHGQDQGKNFVNPANTLPYADQGRHQQLPMHYGPSTHQQMPAPPPPPPLNHGHVVGQSPSTLRPHGPGQVSQPGRPLNPAEHFQAPVKQPYGSFQPELSSHGSLGPGSTSSFGRGPAQFGPQQGSYELQSGVPPGNYNHAHVRPSHPGLPRISQGETPGGGGAPPGSFDAHGGMGGRQQHHGAEGPFGQHIQNNHMEAEFFSDQRFHNFGGRQIESNLPGAWEKGPSGQPLVKHTPGRDERFKPQMEERLNPFPLEPARTLDQASRPLDKAPLRDNYDAGLKLDGAPSRFLPPYHSSGTSFPNDAGERPRRYGPDNNFGRADSSHTHPDFLKPATGFDTHHMDHMPPRSPGKEYIGIPPQGFGSFSGAPHRQSGIEDMDGGPTRPFDEKNRSFNLPPHPVNSFHENRFPLSPMRRGEFDGPGKLWKGDFSGQDDLPSHLRGDIPGPRNLPGHLRFGDSSGFGPFPGPTRMGELPGRGNLPHNLSFGESFGGSKSGHPRLGEPGFRSSYSLQGFPKDGGFFDSGMDSADNPRKRKPVSMGWCRICRVDCETVEGLDMHSQTREHQNKAMDMVLNIKQQNARKQKKSNDRGSREEASKLRSGNEARANKA